MRLGLDWMVELPIFNDFFFRHVQQDQKSIHVSENYEQSLSDHQVMQVPGELVIFDKIFC